MDGVLQNEVGVFNTAALTGESLPRSVRQSGEVLAGMIPVNETIRLSVTKLYSQSTLARMLEMVEEGEVSPGHARALLSFDDPQRMMDVAQKVRTGKYSVRDIERMSKEQEEKEKKSAEEKPQLWGAQASIFTELELALTSELGRKVKVVCSGKDAGGSLQLQFFDEEDLRQLAQKLTKE